MEEFGEDEDGDDLEAAADAWDLDDAAEGDEADVDEDIVDAEGGGLREGEEEGVDRRGR